MSVYTIISVICCSGANDCPTLKKKTGTFQWKNASEMLVKYHKMLENVRTCFWKVGGWGVFGIGGNGIHHFHVPSSRRGGRIRRFVPDFRSLRSRRTWHNPKHQQPRECYSGLLSFSYHHHLFQFIIIIFILISTFIIIILTYF